MSSQGSEDLATLKKYYYKIRRRVMNFLRARGFSEDRSFFKRDYQEYVGPKEEYYEMGPRVLNLLLALGLREDHYLLDIGCGSLRIGRLLIPFLLPEHYCGVEPQSNYIEDGLEREVKSKFGEQLTEYKRPRFDHDETFEFEMFNECFDFAIAISVFIHCGESQFRSCLRNLHGVIHPETKILISVNVGRGSRQTAKKRRLYAGASHVHVVYTMEDIERLAREEGYVANLEFLSPSGTRGYFLFTPVTGTAEIEPASV
jgi:SAM-dependent methyltransferase